MKKITKNIFIILISGLALKSANATTDHSTFIQQIAAWAQPTNQQIAEQRKELIKLYKKHHNHLLLNNHESKALTSLTKAYKVQIDNMDEEKSWQELLSKVDIIPLSMVIAQAANESAWGQSRFAKQANNYFGQHCYQLHCGITPLHRSEGSNLQVKIFDTPQASIKSYIENLNTNRHYHYLRQLRKKQREQHHTLDGFMLSQGLIHYSERKQAYVNSIRSIIQRFNLSQFDN